VARLSQGKNHITYRQFPVSPHCDKAGWSYVVYTCTQWPLNGIPEKQRAMPVSMESVSLRQFLYSKMSAGSRCARTPMARNGGSRLGWMPSGASL
jgi:hypothetical protein